MHNQKYLCSTPGEVLRFEATYEGDTSGIQCPAEKTIFVKRVCLAIVKQTQLTLILNGFPSIEVEGFPLTLVGAGCPASSPGW